MTPIVVVAAVIERDGSFLLTLRPDGTQLAIALSRPLFIYVKKSSLARQEVQDFVRFYLNDGLAQVSKVGYVDPSDALIKASRDAFEAAIAE